MHVLVVEDHAATRRAICTALARRHSVVAAATAGEAMCLDTSSVDVALIDLRLGEDSGNDVVRHLADRLPCVVLTQSSDPDDLFEALGAGARGYLLKSDPPSSVMQALEAVCAGQLPLSAGMTAHLAAPYIPREHPYTLEVSLTEVRAVLRAQDTRCEFVTEQSVSLLYVLGRRFRAAEDPWLPDDELCSAIWGREHLQHGANNLNVLIHRVRRRALRAGLERPFLFKRSGRTSIDVGRVRVA